MGNRMQTYSVYAGYDGELYLLDDITKDLKSSINFILLQFPESLYVAIDTDIDDNLVVSLVEK